MPAAPAVNAGTSRLARSRVAPAIGPAATSCPVGVWCRAPTSRPRPDRTSSERHREGQWEERVSGRGRGGTGAERGDRPGRVRRERTRGKKTPQGEAMPHPYLHGRETARRRGSWSTTRQGEKRRGEGRAEMNLGTTRPSRTYVSGRSTDTGYTGTRALIWTAGYRMTGSGKGGGVTSGSCHRGATKSRAGNWVVDTQTPW